MSEMIESQDGKERTAKVMMPNKSILQRSFIHLSPLESNGEEQLNETPSKLDSNVNRKGDELKNDELRTEINEGDKVKHRQKRTAAFEARNSTSQARTFWWWWECRERVRTFIYYHKRARTFANIQSI